MSKNYFPIVTSCLNNDNLSELIQPLSTNFSGTVKFREAQPGFLGPLDSVVLASIISGGAAVAVSLIKGLFLLWNQKLVRSQTIDSAKQEKPVVILKTSRMTINIRSEEDLPTEGEIGEDQILELRLDIKES